MCAYVCVCVCFNLWQFVIKGDGHRWLNWFPLNSHKSKRQFDKTFCCLQLNFLHSMEGNYLQSGHPATTDGNKINTFLGCLCGCAACIIACGLPGWTATRVPFAFYYLDVFPCSLVYKIHLSFIMLCVFLCSRSSLLWSPVVVIVC